MFKRAIHLVGQVYKLGALILLTFSTIQFSYSQTQKPSVRTGVTFQWADTQAVPQDPATIVSITIDDVVYESIAAPSSYALTRLGPDGNAQNNVIQNGTNVVTTSADPNWNNSAISAFQDKNLNHYFHSNRNGRNICTDFGVISSTDAQIQSLFYNPGIPSNDGGVIAITERNANNCYYVSIYGVPAGGGPEQFLGDTFVRSFPSAQSGPTFAPPPDGVDYWSSGRVVENNGTLGIAIFVLEDLAPVGSVITRVDLTASTQDHGDGKFFILQRYAKPRNVSECRNLIHNGDLNGISIPTGSTFSLVSSPTPAGVNFEFNSDGTFTYEPNPGFIGDVTFDYEVCLPAPNADICDTSTVIITYKGGPDSGCECNNGSANAPGLNN